MKSTGIVRKLDNLGRIVIPKEIRKNMHIKDGEDLEIYMDKDSIILKKFSNIDNFSSLSDDIVSSINYIVQQTVLITDLEKVVSCSGKEKNKLINNYISRDLFELIKSRRSCIFDNESIDLIDGEKIYSFAITPIIACSEIMGSIMIISSDRKLMDSDLNIIKLMATFFSKYLEE